MPKPTDGERATFRLKCAGICAARRLPPSFPAKKRGRSSPRGGRTPDFAHSKPAASVR
jgi:hypothetical protein